MKELTPIYLLTLAWKRLWILILAAAVFAAAVFSYCKFFVTPTYKSTASIIATNGAVVTGTYQNDRISGGDISASLYLAETVVDILAAHDIYSALAEEVDGYSAGQLRSMASISRRNDDTLFFDVSFTASNPSEAKMLANAFSKKACEYIVKFIPSAHVMVASTALEGNKVGPTTLKNTLVAAFIGAVLALVIVIFADQIKKEISDEDDFTQSFEIPLLGAVPDFEGAEYFSSYEKGGYTSGN